MPAPHHSFFFKGQVPYLPSNQQHQSTKGKWLIAITWQPNISSTLPRDLASIVCSRVCPPASNPVSNSPLVALTTSTDTSACAAPAQHLHNCSICRLGCGLRWAEGSTSSIVFAGWRQCALMWGHTGATRRIRLNRPSAVAMQHHVKLLWPLVLCL